jgi:hypothetical protein
MRKGSQSDHIPVPVLALVSPMNIPNTQISPGNIVAQTR